MPGGGAEDDSNGRKLFEKIAERIGGGPKK